MDYNKKIVKILAVVALVLVSACIVVALIDKNDYSKDDHIVDEIPSPNDILYGLEKYGETEFSIESVINYYLNNKNYSRHTIKDEYCMVYQITNEEEAREVEKILGIRENLPAIDYSNKYMILSTGRELIEINIKLENYDENNNQIMTFEYAEGDYKEETAYIYIMNQRKFSSGEMYEKYLWEIGDEAGNLIYDYSVNHEMISEGKRYKLYLRDDGNYVYILYDTTGQTVRKHVVSEKPVEITDISETLLKVDDGEKSVYYNSVKNSYSEEYNMPTTYLIYNIIYYMRDYEGRTQLILRDAYNKKLYAKIIELPFAESDDIHSLVKSVSVISDTAVWVEYYKGEKNELVKEQVEVYYMKR